MKGLKELKQAIFLAAWENQQCELRIGHATEELKEMQIVTITKEMQAAMNNPGGAVNDQDARLGKLMEGSTMSFKQQCAMRSTRLTRLTERVAASIEAHEELTTAECDAEAEAAECGGVREVTLRNNRQAEAESKRHLRALVTNAQLQAIAKEQTAELGRLQRQLDEERQRSYPVMAPPVAAYPDLRLPPVYGAKASPSRAASAVPGQRRAVQSQRVATSR